jgi:hypothetical protein
MAAGLGFKTFTTGEVLTAGDVNGYLMQGVLVFASTAARDAAITSPQEGQFAYTKDTNGLWYYDGATWVASGATGDIEGVTAGVGISGGGTSGTVTVTNSMATAITTKGDLVVGTGSGTFVREGVGANNTVLTADSAQADGLKWAASATSTLTTTGDTLYASGANTLARLGIGSTGNVLTVAGGVPTWAAPSGSSKNFTLLNSGGTAMSGSSSTTISGISGKGSLMIAVKDAGINSSNGTVHFRINGDSGANYDWFGGRYSWDTSYDQSNYSNFAATGDVYVPLYINGNPNGTGSATIFVEGANSSGVKTLDYNGVSDGSSSGSTPRNYFGGGVWNNSATITSITITTTAGTFDGGRLYVYASA